MYVPVDAHHDGSRACLWLHHPHPQSLHSTWLISRLDLTGQVHDLQQAWSKVQITVQNDAGKRRQMRGQLTS